MSHFNDICLICLKHSDELKLIRYQYTNGANIEDKLKYFLPEIEFKSNIPRYICTKCENNLSSGYEFKLKCLQNITTFEKYAQQITTKRSDENILVPRTEIEFVNVVNNAEFVIKKEAEEELVIKEELILNEELDPILGEIGKEKSESDVCNKNESIIGENIQISDKTSEQNNVKEFRQESNNFKTHQVTHTYKKSYICEICKKSFRQLQHLKTHQLIHTGEKPHTCEVCNESFRQLETLKQHKLLHSGEKPFTCEVCNKPFRHSKTFKRHKLVHTGEKPYMCEVCQKPFRRLETLKQHKLIHTGEKPFICEVCKKSFMQLSTLSRHRLTHTDKKPFICEVCNESFRSMYSLKQHKLRSHI